VVVIRDAERLVLIDRYLRVEALRRLHRDTVTATARPVSEVEVLVHHRHPAATRRAAIEAVAAGCSDSRCARRISSDWHRGRSRRRSERLATGSAEMRGRSDGVRSAPGGRSVPVFS
jgi:hypothetical protein